MTLWLTESDVRAVLEPLELIDAMESALAAFSAGEIVQPVRNVLDIAPRSFFAAMPAFYGERSIVGAKLVSVLPANAARGLPTHMASISLFDARTGQLAAVVDGRYITEVRTAAVSAVSLRHMGRGSAGVLAILGSGVQAGSHLEALTALHRFSEIRAWSPTAANLERFVKSTEHAVTAAASAEDAVRGADAVVLVTNSPVPAIDSRWVSDGAHVMAVGSCRPTQQEVDPVLMARARVVVDSREAAMRESGDILLPIAEGRFTASHVTAELGEVACGKKPGRASDGEVTLFKSLGLAVEDLVAADLAYRRACEKGLGTQLPS